MEFILFIGILYLLYWIASGHGFIVKPDWIRQCHIQKKRLAEGPFDPTKPIRSKQQDFESDTDEYEVEEEEDDDDVYND